MGAVDPVAAFLEAACVPLDGWHASGTLDEAEALLAAHPAIAGDSVYTAAVLGDEAGVRRCLAADPARATAPGGPRGWDPLTHLCFSRYLRLDAARSAGFVRAAEALLDAGASPNTGWYATDHDPPEFESAIYGAAGVAHHPELTRLLLARGADPNDGETAYHTPETVDDRALQVLVESGKLTADSLTTMLHRKLDWFCYDAVAWLLAHGADPNRISHWGRRVLHHALGRTNPLRYFELLLDHGADPTLPARDGTLAPSIAARMGRADVLQLFERRGFPVALAGDEAFLAACARADETTARAFVAADPGLVARLQAADAAILADFAGAGNTEGVRLLLDLGFDLGSRTGRGGAQGDTALQVAVWRERLATVQLLIARGAPLEDVNRRGETALSLAVRAMVERSDWTPHGSADIVAALLDAGARVDSVATFPSGSAEADTLLRRHGRQG
jgi:ankyrin repeat protein